MDSVTQIALGASVGYATLGRQAGRRALVWGAVLGTLPDLDILLPIQDPVAAFTQHRSWSHSLPVLALATPLFGWLAWRIHGRAQPLGRWVLLAGLVLLTHVLLDAFTVYGTQLLWPFCLPPDGRSPESWSTVFVIDPAYTLPLLVGIAVAWFRDRPSPQRARWWNGVGLALSTLYLGWTVGAKLHVERVVAESLARQGIEHRQVLTTPTPLNSLLWRVVVMREGSYLEGYHSLVADDPSDDVAWTESPNDPELIAALREIPDAECLRWFTDGFFSALDLHGQVVVRDLRMGAEPDYAFAFLVAERTETGALEPIASERVESRMGLDRLAEVWERLVHGARAPR